jgi:hypothetical protein
MNRANRQRALDMMQADPRHELYEGATVGGNLGSGLFYLTYSEGKGPVLDRPDIDNLLSDGLIVEKYPGCYVLAGGTASTRASGS